MSDENEAVNHLLAELSAEVVSAYVANNAISANGLPELISEVHQTFQQLSGVAEPAEPVQEPAVPIKKSKAHDHMICLECGKSFKSLKRHLRTRHDLTPAAYRDKWGLPADYPMVAPAYATNRSELAKKSGLGRKAKA